MSTSKQLPRYYKLTDCLKTALVNTMTNFVTVGYYLRTIKQEKLYEVSGYKDIYDYAKDKFDLSVSSVSRFIAINVKFSDPKTHRTLDSKYTAINAGPSKLSEMLTMTDEEIEQVTAETTVKELREIKAKRKAKEPEICDVAKEEPQPELEVANEANPETIVNTGLPELPRDEKKSEKQKMKLPAVSKKPKREPEPSDEEIAAFCYLEGITEKTSFEPEYLKEVWGFGYTKVTNEYVCDTLKSWEGSKNGLEINGKGITWERLSERLKGYYYMLPEPQPEEPQAEICDVAKMEKPEIHIDYSLQDVEVIKKEQDKILMLVCRHNANMQNHYCKQQQIFCDALELLYQSLQKTPLAEEEE